MDELLEQALKGQVVFPTTEIEYGDVYMALDVQTGRTAIGVDAVDALQTLLAVL